MNVAYIDDKILKVADRLVQLSVGLSSNPSKDNTGAMLYLDLGRGQERVCYPIGEESASLNNPLYNRWAQEKAHRLFSDWLRDPTKYFFSWQTRDEKLMRYGGAVLFPVEGREKVSAHIISVSGLAELTDEAISLTLGHYLELTTEENARKIAAFSENKVFEEMFEVFYKKG